MPTWVFVERARGVDIVMDAKQVPHRVSVFIAAQPVHGDRSPSGHSGGQALVDPCGNPSCSDTGFLGRGLLLLFFRRHLPRVDAGQDFRPVLRDQFVPKVSGEVVQAEFALLLFSIVAADAIVLEVVFDPFVRMGGVCCCHAGQG